MYVHTYIHDIYTQMYAGFFDTTVVYSDHVQMLSIHVCTCATHTYTYTCISLTDEASDWGKGANSIVSRLHHFFAYYGLGRKSVTYVHMYARTYIHMYVCVNIYVHLHAYIRTYIHVCAYMYVDTYMQWFHSYLANHQTFWGYAATVTPFHSLR